MTQAIEPLGIQDAPDGPGPLTADDRGKVLAWNGDRVVAERLAGAGTPAQIYVTGGRRPASTAFDFYLNVEDYNVVGDGVTDNTDAINAMLSDAPANSVCFFPNGTYIIGGTIQPPEGKQIHLQGESTYGAEIKAASGFTGDAMLTYVYGTGNQALGCELLHLTLNANQNAARCVWLQKGKAFRLENLRLFRHTLTGIEFAGNGGSGAVSYDHRMSNCDIDGDASVDRDDHPAYGIHLSSGGTDNKFYGVSISYQKTYGIYCQASNNLFTAMHCWGGMDYGLYASTGRQSVMNSYFDTCRVAGIGAAASYLNIIGNIFFHNLDNTIGVDPADGIRLILNNRQGLSVIGNRFDRLDRDWNLNGRTLGTNNVFAGNYGTQIVTADSLTDKWLFNSDQIFTTRRTGWGAPTGTATRTAFATGTVTTAQLAERVKALIDDLTTHGIIGS